MKKRKGIILAGGTGSRLLPITKAISKQLIPVYDKPMIYYSISVLLLAKIQDIAIIVNPHELSLFQRLLGDGSEWGVHFTYIPQPKPEGIAQAFILAESYLDGSPSALILGDNLFFGHGLPALLDLADRQVKGATVFVHPVADPKAYGVIEINQDGKTVAIEEKPAVPKSNLAVTGLYFYDENASKYARTLNPSKRGELEITDLNQLYINNENEDFHVSILGRGYAWLDTGSPGSLLKASSLVETIQERQGLMIGCPEEISYKNRFIDREGLLNLINKLGHNSYRTYLQGLLEVHESTTV